MLDFMIYVMIQSFWIAMGLLIVMFFIRITIAVSQKQTLKKKLLIVFMPFSYGVYRYAPSYPYLRRYEHILILQFIFMFIASIFILYIRLGVTII